LAGAEDPESSSLTSETELLETKPSDAEKTTSDKDARVTEADPDVEEGGLPVLGILIAVVLIMVPLTICVAMKLIARKCPNSAIGRKLNAFTAIPSGHEEVSEV